MADRKLAAGLIKKESKRKSIEFTVNIGKQENSMEEACRSNEVHKEEHNVLEGDTDAVETIHGNTILNNVTTSTLSDQVTTSQIKEQGNEDSVLKILNTKLLFEISNVREELEAVKAPAKVKNIYKQLFTKKKQLIRAKETIEKLQNRIDNDEKEEKKYSVKTKDYYANIKRLENDNEDLSRELEKIKNTSKELQKDNLMLTELMKEVDENIQTGIDETEQENNTLCETENIIDEFENDYKELQDRYSQLVQEIEKQEVEKLKVETNEHLLEMEKIEREWQKKYSKLLEEQAILMKENDILRESNASTQNEHGQKYSKLMSEMQVISDENERLYGCNQVNNFQEMEAKYNKLIIEHQRISQIEVNLMKMEEHNSQLHEKERAKVKDLEEELSIVKSTYSNLFLEMEIISQDNERLNESITSDHEGDIQNQNNKEEQNQFSDIITQLRFDLQQKNEEIESLCSLERENEDLQMECEERKKTYTKLKESYTDVFEKLNSLKEVSMRNEDMYWRLHAENEQLVEAYQTSISDISTLKSDITWYELQLERKKKTIVDQSNELDKTLEELHQLLSLLIGNNELSKLKEIKLSASNEVEVAKENKQQVDAENEDVDRPVDTPTFIEVFLKDSDKDHQRDDNVGRMFHTEEDVKVTTSTSLIGELRNIVAKKDIEITSLKDCNKDLEEKLKEKHIELLETQRTIELLQKERDVEIRKTNEIYQKQISNKDDQLSELSIKVEKLEEKCSGLDGLKEKDNKIEYFKKELKESLVRIEEVKRSASPEKDIQFQVTKAHYMKGMKEKEDEIDQLKEKIKQMERSTKEELNDAQTSIENCESNSEQNLAKMDELNSAIKIEIDLKRKIEEDLAEKELTISNLNNEMKNKEQKNKELETEVDKLVEQLKEKDEHIIIDIGIRKENEENIDQHQKDLEGLAAQIINLENEKSTMERELSKMTEQVYQLANGEEGVEQYKKRVNELEEQIDTAHKTNAENEKRFQLCEKNLTLGIKEQEDEIENLKEKIEKTEQSAKEKLNVKQNIIETLENNSKQNLAKIDELIFALEKEVNRQKSIEERLTKDLAEKELEVEFLKKKTNEEEGKNKELKIEIDQLIELLQQKDENIIRDVDIQKANEDIINIQQNDLDELMAKVTNLENKERKEESAVKGELLKMTEQIEDLINDKDEVDKYKQRISQLEEEAYTLNIKNTESKNRNQSEIEYLQLTLENRVEELDNAEKANTEKDNIIKKIKKNVENWKDKYFTQESMLNRSNIEITELKNDLKKSTKKYDTLRAETESNKRNPIRESKITVKKNRMVSFNDDVALNRYSFVDVEGSEIDYTQLFKEMGLQQGQPDVTKTPVLPLVQTISELAQTSESTQTSAQTPETIQEEVIVSASICNVMSESGWEFEPKEQCDTLLKSAATTIEPECIPITTATKEDECKTMDATDENANNQQLLTTTNVTLTKHVQSNDIIKKPTCAPELNNVKDTLDNTDKIIDLEKKITKYKAENMKLLSDCKYLKNENETKQWQLKAKDVLLSNSDEIVETLEKQTNATLELEEKIENQTMEIDLKTKELEQEKAKLKQTIVLLESEQKSISQLEQVIGALEKEIENHQSQIKENDIVIENQNHDVIIMKANIDHLKETHWKEKGDLRKKIDDLEAILISEQRKLDSGNLKLQSFNLELQQEVTMLQSQLEFADSVDGRANEISTSIIEELEEKIKSKDIELDEIRSKLKKMEQKETVTFANTASNDVQLEQYVILDEQGEQVVLGEQDKQVVLDEQNKQFIITTSVDIGAECNSDEFVAANYEIEQMENSYMKLKGYNQLLLTLKEQIVRKFDSSKQLEDTPDEMAEEISAACKQLNDADVDYISLPIIEQIGQQIDDVITLINQAESLHEISPKPNNELVKTSSEHMTGSDNNDEKVVIESEMVDDFDTNQIIKEGLKQKSDELEKANRLISILKDEKDTLCHSVTVAQRINDTMTLQMLESQNSEIEDSSNISNDITDGKTEHDINILIRDLEIKRLRTLLAAKYFKKKNLLSRNRKSTIQTKSKKKPEILFENNYADKHNFIVFSNTK